VTRWRSDLCEVDSQFYPWRRRGEICPLASLSQARCIWAIDKGIQSALRRQSRDIGDHNVWPSTLMPDFSRFNNAQEKDSRVMQSSEAMRFFS
jgi:hypothetical protein